MKQVLTKTLWGCGSPNPADWDALFARIQADGYEAVECLAAFSFAGGKAKLYRESLAKHNLRCIVQIHTSSHFNDAGEYVYLSSTDVQEHVDSFKQLLVEAKEVAPVMVNCHSGHDSWTTEQAVSFFTQAREIAESLDVRVVYETHRQRLFSNPYSTAAILADPGVRGKIEINADLSHWVVGCEHIFDSSEARDSSWWPNALALVAEHCGLVHCRVGYDQGPQVAHPNDPAVKRELAAHLKWWRCIWQSQAARGLTESFNEMEFGPPPYLQTLPYTGQPVSDLWAVNNAMKDLVAKHFDETEFAS